MIHCDFGIGLPIHNVSLIFLCFAEGGERDIQGYLTEMTKATEPLIKWDQLVKKCSGYWLLVANTDAHGGL